MLFDAARRSRDAPRRFFLIRTVSLPSTSLRRCVCSQDRISSQCLGTVSENRRRGRSKSGRRVEGGARTVDVPGLEVKLAGASKFLPTVVPVVRAAALGDNDFAVVTQQDKKTERNRNSKPPFPYNTLLIHRSDTMRNACLVELRVGRRTRDREEGGERD